MAGRGLLRALIVLTAAAAPAVFALRKLGMIGAGNQDSAIDYASGSDSSGDGGEDDATDE